MEDVAHQRLQLSDQATIPLESQRGRERSLSEGGQGQELLSQPDADG